MTRNCIRKSDPAHKRSLSADHGKFVEYQNHNGDRIAKETKQRLDIDFSYSVVKI